MQIAQKDRRTATRMPVQRACRLRRQTGLVFGAARTVNVSTRGALLELDAPRPLTKGERLSVAVAWDNGPMVGASSFVPARVVRADLNDQGRQTVALQFDHSDDLAIAA